MKDKPERAIPEKLLKEIRNAESIVVVTHTNPDGDALGSLFATAEILESYGKRVLRFLEEPVSYLFDFLPGCELATVKVEDFQKFVDCAEGAVLILALDCGDEERLGCHRELLMRYRTAVIDHHRSHREFGNISWIDADSSSTGEMIYEVTRSLGVRLSYSAAYNLYVAICTDTGSFRYECTTSRTMHIAAELLDHGVRPEVVGRHLYDNYSHERLKLMELVLSTVHVCFDGQIAFIHVSDQMLKKSGATMQDVEGFIDFPRSLRSVKVAALLKEGENGHIGVSLRAKGDCDVSKIARLFNGGGHRNAAGFRCHGKTIEQVRLEVKDAISRVL